MKGQIMKRTELEVGKEYWYSRSTRWDEELAAGSKVVVVDTGCWTQPRSGWTNMSPEPFKAKSGLGVLVDLTNRSYGGVEKVTRMVVNVTTIRGPYEETKKKVEEFTEARTKKVREAREISAQRDDEAKEAANLAKRLGITVYPRGGGNDTLVISAADLTLLINAVNPDL